MRVVEIFFELSFCTKPSMRFYTECGLAFFKQCKSRTRAEQSLRLAQFELQAYISRGTVTDPRYKLSFWLIHLPLIASAGSFKALCEVNGRGYIAHYCPNSAKSYLGFRRRCYLSLNPDIQIHHPTPPPPPHTHTPPKTSLTITAFFGVQTVTTMMHLEGFTQTPPQHQFHHGA